MDRPETRQDTAHQQPSGSDEVKQAKSSEAAERRPATSQTNGQTPRPGTRQQGAKSVNRRPGTRQQTFKSAVAKLRPVTEVSRRLTAIKEKSVVKAVVSGNHHRIIHCDFYINSRPVNPVRLQIRKGVEFTVLPQLLCKLQEEAFSSKINGSNYLPWGVQFIFDSVTGKPITDANQLKNSRLYVISSSNSFNKNVKYGQQGK